MPLLNVSISGAPDADLSAAIASTLTDLTAAHLGKDPGVTAVAITYIGSRDWFIGRQSVDHLPVRTFSLEIKVTAGTNTKSEVSAYLAAVFQGLSEHLNGVADISYILVHEVPAANWGYVGITQEYRSVARIPKGA